VDATEARRVLGVGPGESADGLRAAYRDALHRTHPDLHGGDGAPTRAVVEAYRALVGTAPPDADPSASAQASAPAPPPAPEREPGTVVVVDGDTVAADLPAGDLFAMLVEVGHRIGDVAYVDRGAGLLEIIVTFGGYGACSVVLTLQGRAAGLTEAFCTVEALGTGPAPPASAVADLLAAGLRSVGASP
jgi:hypothetical protein